VDFQQILVSPDIGCAVNMNGRLFQLVFSVGSDEYGNIRARRGENGISAIRFNCDASVTQNLPTLPMLTSLTSKRD
jgi:hypothetical protein